METFRVRCPHCKASYAFVDYKTGIGKTDAQREEMTKRRTVCRECNTPGLVHIDEPADNPVYDFAASLAGEWKAAVRSLDDARLPIGTAVRTTQDAGAKDWQPRARAGVKWGSFGIVVAVHDAHGLVYDVKHEDGTIAPYEPEELAYLKRTPSVSPPEIDFTKDIAGIPVEDWQKVEDNPIPVVCPRCGGGEDLCDNLGDGEHAVCLRCGLCWMPGGHTEPWPCAVCLVGDDVALERVRAALRHPDSDMRRKMFGAAVFLGEPACTEIRMLLDQLRRIDDAIEGTEAPPTATAAPVGPPVRDMGALTPAMLMSLADHCWAVRETAIEIAQAIEAQDSNAGSGEQQGEPEVPATVGARALPSAAPAPAAEADDS